MSRRLRKRPSEIINAPDEYTAFCFDEACEMLVMALEKKDGPKPVWPGNEKPGSGETEERPSVGGKGNDLVSFLKDLGGGQ